MTFLSHPMKLPLLSLHNDSAMSHSYDTPIEIGLRG